MAHYLSLQATYTTYQLGLYDNHTCIAFSQHDKKNASKELILALDHLLKNNHCNLTDLTFIGVNQGPGPFTSLRIIITTANALSFAHAIPLVGINSLEALLEEVQLPSPCIKVALLNAYNQDIYYAIAHSEKSLEQGCKNSQLFFMDLKDQYPQEHIQFIGNGTLLYKETIEKLFGSDALSPQILEEASLATIAHMSLTKFGQNETDKQLLPLYLKPLSYQPIHKT